MTPNLYVKSALDYLASRLDPIIGERFARELGGHPWTVILRIIDEKKGRKPSDEYMCGDLQPQLRMLTEWLGEFAYPFDRGDRISRTLAGELRIFRNRLSHTYRFEMDEAYRAADTSARLLAELADAGATHARTIADDILMDLARERGLTRSAVDEVIAKTDSSIVADEGALSGGGADGGAGAGASAGTVAGGGADAGAGALPGGGAGGALGYGAKQRHQGLVPTPTGATRGQSRIGIEGEWADEHVEPAPEVMASDRTFIGASRLPYQPWQVARDGDRTVIEDLRKKSPRLQVRSVALEIVDFEWPIAVERLVRLTASSFGVTHLGGKLKKQLERQVVQCGAFVDDDKFVWPSDIDPTTWDQFRPNGSDVGREFTHISPVEIANAAKFISAKRPELGRAELESEVLRTFGRARRSGKIRTHLENAMERAG
ncbi:Swt1 family HEPN domain-containing protein [Rarobacter incanus]|nr:Swt1 family HEPN domain-containing protein [Rarobacter incanus]